MSELFKNFAFARPSGALTLSNRVVVAPMCQYSAQQGCANDWHLAHWIGLLNGGAGLVMLEATAVTEEGRITPGCLGLYNEATAAALDDHLQRARRQAPPVPVCLQLAHAGRKGSSAEPWNGGGLLGVPQGGWPTLAPSALAHAPGEATPQALDDEGLARIAQAFVHSARQAADMGIEAIELHAAHGYLLHEFLSPVSNHRTDAYGGNFEGRIRYPLEVFAAVRQAYAGVLGMRISASDWVEGGWTPEETADLALRLKQAGADFVHISSGGVSPQQKIAIGPGYQVPFARMAKQKSGLPTIAVGLITQPEQANQVLADGDADLVALARAFLYNPRWGWAAAAALGGEVTANAQYWRCLPPGTGRIFGNIHVGMR
jgi:2,4-dienoyl-CoA reductase-like NADH-dependent reductase (Old Yellow Enzyme family)